MGAIGHLETWKWWAKLDLVQTPVALPRKTALGSRVSLAPALEGLRPNAAGLRLSGMGITEPLPLGLQYVR